jgi:hypothetical protein
MACNAFFHLVFGQVAPEEVADAEIEVACLHFGQARRHMKSKNFSIFHWIFLQALLTGFLSIFLRETSLGSGGPLCEHRRPCSRIVSECSILQQRFKAHEKTGIFRYNPSFEWHSADSVFVAFFCQFVFDEHLRILLYRPCVSFLEVKIANLM